jgi:CRP/FNR family transcriptional regulator, cyclic AMP receptor protein
MGELAGVVVRADALGAAEIAGPVTATDSWIREVIGAHHPVLGRLLCPFVPPALDRATVYYAPISGCRSAEEVMRMMEALVERFVALPPRTGPDTHLKTLVAIFVDIEPSDGERVVVGAHRQLKDRCTERGLMVGEFAPGYLLPSSRDAAVTVGESPVPVLALRHMLPSDRRFLDAEDRWMASWARRFGADRVPLFEAFSEGELAAVGRLAKETTANAGEVLCQQADMGHEFFLILEGEAVVRRSGEEVSRLGPRDHFGELALLTRERRNATVSAATDMRLLVLGRHDFKEVIESTPSLAHKLLAGLAARLSEADSQSIHDAP